MVFVYPSSLFYHFNIDINGWWFDLSTNNLTHYYLLDIKFVTTEGDALPTPENCRPIQDGDDDGRGSVVWFNMATMFQSSESGADTLKEVRERGESGYADMSAQEAFEYIAIKEVIFPMK